LGSDHLGWDVCVNFIKAIFQILRNDVIGNINKFNLATLFACTIIKTHLLAQDSRNLSKLHNGIKIVKL
jgi:hypothetical protein